MPNNYYERLSEMNPGELADGLAMEQEFDAIGRGFAKLPEPHRDGQGFEGPTRVGDPVEETDAVNLGTLEKLNLPIYRKKITTEDWNTIIDAGIYDVVNASGANKAPGYSYGVLVVHVLNGVVTQLFYPDKNGSLIKRACQNISMQSWLDWDAAYNSSMGATGFRNKIINGDFSINQRAYVSGSATAAGKYTLDRWKVTGATGITFSKSNGKTTVTIPAGQTLVQIIEAVNLPAGEYVLSWDGTAQGRVDLGAYGSSGSVKFAAAGGSDALIEFSAGTIANVQLELGYAATAFEYRPYSYELSLCQRYYQKLDCSFMMCRRDVGSTYIVSNAVRITSMRVNPSVTIIGQPVMQGIGFPNVANVRFSASSDYATVALTETMSLGIGTSAQMSITALLDAEL